MRKKREFTEGAAYYVTSRTNDKKRVFESNVGWKTMPLVLEDAREKFAFRLANFCIMPTHIHLLIISGEGENLSRIMQCIKAHSAKRWNRIHGSTDRLRGERRFARSIKDPREYFHVMDYIDQNPVKSGLSQDVGKWKACGAYHIRRGLSGLVDYTGMTRLSYIKPPPRKTAPDTSWAAIQNGDSLAFAFHAKTVSDTSAEYPCAAA